MIILFFLMATMQTNNEAAVAFGKARCQNMLKPSAREDNELLSEAKELEQEEIPQEGDSVDNDTREMLNARADNKSDPLDRDRLVTEMTERGDKIVNDPKAPIQISAINPATNQDATHTCEESLVEPQDYFFRVLRINYQHHNEVRMRSCTRKIQYCTEGNHDEDVEDCGAKDYRVGETVSIPYERSCSSLGWYGYYHDREYTYVSQPERTDYLGDEWFFEDPKGLAKEVSDNKCNFLKTICVEGPEERTFYKLKVQRNCWREKIIVSMPGAKTNTCLQWRQQGCAKISETCTQYAEDGKTCLTYQKQYRCPTRTAATVTMDGQGIHCIDGGSLVARSPKFNDAAQALTQLAGLAEMQKEIQDQNSKTPIVFKGKCLNCKKNICPNFLYDCCQAKDGFAIELGLTDCSPQEIELAAARETGRCHSLGSYPNKVIGLWTSSHTHVYCCFPSKLAYILQKEARKQLSRTFGTIDKPDCSGLSMEEIALLDFSEMDLSELFDEIVLNKAKPDNLRQSQAPTQAHMEEKLKSLKIPEKPL